jgi:hypothetical protein
MALAIATLRRHLIEMTMAPSRYIIAMFVMATLERRKTAAVVHIPTTTMAIGKSDWNP